MELRKRTHPISAGARLGCSWVAGQSTHSWVGQGSGIVLKDALAPNGPTCRPLATCEQGGTAVMPNQGQYPFTHHLPWLWVQSMAALIPAEPHHSGQSKGRN